MCLRDDKAQTSNQQAEVSMMSASQDTKERKIMKIMALASAMVPLLVAGAVSAQDIDNGRFSAEFVFELQSDSVVDSDDSASEFTNVHSTVEAALSYQMLDTTSLNASLVFEQLRDQDDDSFNEDHGAYIEELFILHDFGPLAVQLGKFNPGFGFAWDAAPGIYGVDFAEDYEITEKVGAAVIVPLKLAGSEHEFALSIFNADRSALSDSIGISRGQTSLGDGGVSNTDSPESYVVSLSGELSGTGYTIAYQHQEAGEGDDEDQSGVVLGVTRDFGGFEGLAEIAYFDSFDGTKASATYFTIGGAVPIADRLSISGVYSYRDIENAADDHLLTAALEYEFLDGFTGSLGYRYGDEDEVESHTIGALLVYEF